MRYQGCNSDGEELSGMYVVHDPKDTGTKPEGPSCTRQEFKDECDINVLMAGYEKNAALPPVNPGTPQYLDVSDVPDFRRALDIVNDAADAFYRLPAGLRKELDNDVVRFVEYAQDPANIETMRRYGLAEPEKAKEPPLEVRVVQEAPPGGAKP